MRVTQSDRATRMALGSHPHVRQRRLVLRQLPNPGTQIVFIVETDLVLDAAAAGYDPTAIELLNQEIAEELSDLKVNNIEIVSFVPEGQDEPS